MCDVRPIKIIRYIFPVTGDLMNYLRNSIVYNLILLTFGTIFIISISTWLIPVPGKR